MASYLLGLEVTINQLRTRHLEHIEVFYNGAAWGAGLGQCLRPAV